LTSGPMFLVGHSRQFSCVWPPPVVGQYQNSVVSVGIGVTQCYRDRRFEIIAQ
jgi:hypothetical protein